MSRTGTHTWKIVGLDADGQHVVSAARRFRVVGSR
jgi:hypothetical protein